MFRRIAAVMVCLLPALPAAAGELKPDEARRFVVGKLFAYNCFDGTRGAGRIYNDGSVSGTVQFRGSGPVRHVTLPAGTLKTGQKVCATVKGMPFEPCFNLDQKDAQSFRGSLSGLGFAYCDFTRRGGRGQLMRASIEQPAPAAAPLRLRRTLAAATEQQ
jgi:hypothetical protein